MGSTLRKSLKLHYKTAAQKTMCCTQYAITDSKRVRIENQKVRQLFNEKIRCKYIRYKCKHEKEKKKNKKKHEKRIRGHGLQPIKGKTDIVHFLSCG